MKAARLALALLLGAAAPLPAQVAQERLDLDVVQRIRDEGLHRSGVEQLAGHLTDVIGPRLTGSPQMRQANEWAAQVFRGWGLANVVIEPWGEFGRGWELVSYAGRVTGPHVQALKALPMAWTGSTSGTVTGAAVIVDAGSVEELKSKYRGRLKNSFVLTQEPIEMDPEFRGWKRRFDAADLLPRVALPEDRDVAQEESPPSGRPQFSEEQRQRMQLRAALNGALDTLLRAEGGVALRPSPWQYGVLRVGGAGSRNPADPIAAPVLLVAQEQYNQIYRNVKRGVPVRLEANVQTRFHTQDLREYNVLADLPGTDRASELVIIGAHLDSWHGGTGATDNAAGSVVMMEAMRILKTLGVQPRRTIRIALWSGEEQGLLGSRHWVQNHPDLHGQISAYLNVDNGTGRIRGIWNQGNEQATAVFEQILFPFRDLGVVAVRRGNTSGTDHLSFDRAGIPGFNFIQDPIEYSLRTHHSSVDTYDQLIIDDLKQAAVVVAATAYHLAMRDEMMPRKPAPATD